MADSLKVSEIFLSIQGESTRAGLPCTIVRLAGCNLRCRWCDTKYTWEDGEEMPVDEVLARVRELRCARAEVTGGEPLVQPASLELMQRLCEQGYETLLETNGSLDLSRVPARVTKIMDIKCPSSGEADATCWANLDHLLRGDEVKFVLANRSDYEYACQIDAEHLLSPRLPVTFSPVHGVLPPAELAGWILEDGLDVRLGLQLHKIIWPDRERGV